MTLRILIPTISLVSTLVLSGLAVGTYTFLFRNVALQDAEYEIKERLDHLEGDLIRFDIDKDLLRANRNLLTLSSWRAIEWAFLVQLDSSDRRMKVVGSFSRKDIDKEVDEKFLKNLDCEKAERFFQDFQDGISPKGVGIIRCEDQPQVLGGLQITEKYFVIISVRLNSIINRLDKGSRSVFLTLVGCFIAYFTVLYFFLNHTLFRRAVRLLNASHALKMGDYSARSRLSGQDELGLISHSFDAMAERVEIQTRELNELNRELESKVEARARESTQLYEALEASLKQREDILSSLTHEMKTPLTGFVTLTESVVEGAFGPVNEGQDETLRLAIGSALKLDGLVNRFLDFANLQMSKPRLHLNWELLGRVCDRAVRQLKELEIPVASRLHVDVSEPEALIYIDTRRILESLIYILENAFKFTPSPKKISLEARVGQKELIFKICDEGVGIEKEKLESIFEPLKQLDSTKIRHYSGVGLGLTLAREWVRPHGGEIQVESELGKGSCFTIVIPQTQTPPNLDDI